VAHRARPPHAERHPLHVTLRARFRGMRTQRVFAALTQALRRSAQRAPERFRVVQFSIQADHVHLLVEATGKAALSRGVQGLCISISARESRARAPRPILG
jgi:putative transposase